MKRSAPLSRGTTRLERSKPLKRTGPMKAKRWGIARKPPAPVDPAERAYLAWIRLLDCRALLIPGHRCAGRMTAHHAGRRGTGLRSHYRETIPLCWRAHLDGIEILRDVFTGWTKAEVRAWEDREVAAVQLLATPETLDQARDFEALGLGALRCEGGRWSWVPGAIAGAAAERAA